MYKFDIELLEEANEFLESLDAKAREKVIYNLWRARTVLDPKLFKKLKGKEIWEFRTKYNGIQYRLFAFWDKRDNKNTLVICTNGLIKKTQKTPSASIARALQLMKEYFKN